MVPRATVGPANYNVGVTVQMLRHVGRTIMTASEALNDHGGHDMHCNRPAGLKWEEGSAQTRARSEREAQPYCEALR